MSIHRSIDRLPLPDEYGNYYLERRGMAPCVLVIQSRKSPDRGKYFALGDDNALFDREHRLRVFDTPEEARRALERDRDRRDDGG